MDTETTNRNDYEKPATKVIKLETDMPYLKQTTYHYMGGPDD